MILQNKSILWYTFRDVQIHPEFTVSRFPREGVFNPQQLREALRQYESRHFI